MPIHKADPQYLAECDTCHCFSGEYISAPNQAVYEKYLFQRGWIKLGGAWFCDDCYKARVERAHKGKGSSNSRRS
jgi:hypothetical protein